jgi:lipopolysaccharide transport system ATP-binding protein
MQSEIAVNVKGLSKCFKIYVKPHHRLMQMLLSGDKKYYREFWALKDISFEIKKGETVGVIGRNGSGKSTLLRIICGLLNPTSGAIFTSGRVAALLELGSGFNPEFTGRENVYFNASLLGLNYDEINNRFDEIVSFADIGNFLDQPVKTYSSGMQVRLAFAVQSMVDPEILIIDEALAVGDAKFQAKCFDRLRRMKDDGVSILLVTHSSEQIVSHCSRALLIDHGHLIEFGEPKKVINLYMDLLFGREVKNINPLPAMTAECAKNAHEINASLLSNTSDTFNKHPGYNHHEYRWGDEGAQILDFLLAVEGEVYPSVIPFGSTVQLSLSIKFFSELIYPILGITIKTKEGLTVYGANSETLKFNDFRNQGAKNSCVLVNANFYCSLAAGDYFISVGVATRQGEVITPHDRRYDAIHFHVPENNSFFGLADLTLEFLEIKGVE